MFDYIVMNPPYGGSLHLKILNHVLPFGKDTINLSPILDFEWPEQPSSLDFLKGKLDYIEVVKREEAQKLFCRNPTDLGIYYITKTRDNYWPNPFELRFGQDFTSIWNKVDFSNNFKKHISKRDEPLNKYCVVYNHMSGFSPSHRCIYKDGISLTDGKTYKEHVKNQHKNETTHHFKFDTLEEAENFLAYCNTRFFRFIEHIGQPGLLKAMNLTPYMDTYKRKWTDKDLYELYKFSEEEVNIIERFYETHLLGI